MSHRAILRAFDPAKQIKQLKAQYTTLLLLLTYLVLPGVSPVIFRYFVCENVDPDGTLSGTQRYMVADHSISCTYSGRYLFGFVWALIMVVLYPVGIPLMYFVLLYQVCVITLTYFLV